jgi:hypothetical protein
VWGNGQEQEPAQVTVLQRLSFTIHRRVEGEREIEKDRERERPDKKYKRAAHRRWQKEVKKQEFPGKEFLRDVLDRNALGNENNFAGVKRKDGGNSCSTRVVEESEIW